MDCSRNPVQTVSMVRWMKSRHNHAYCLRLLDRFQTLQDWITIISLLVPPRTGIKVCDYLVISTYKLVTCLCIGRNLLQFIRIYQLWMSLVFLMSKSSIAFFNKIIFLFFFTAKYRKSTLVALLIYSAQEKMDYISNISS